MDNDEIDRAVEAFNELRVSGDYAAASKVAQELSQEDTLSPVLRERWAAEAQRLALLAES